MTDLLRAVTRPELHRGLEGVLVAETELSDIDGDEGRLVYRGYDIGDLSREASFEEVLYLLWRGELPTASELEAFTDSIAKDRAVEPSVIEALRALATADEDPMAALRTGVSMLSASDPEADSPADDLEATRRKGRRITAKTPTLLAAFDRLRREEEPVEPDPDLGLAANFLYMLDGIRPDGAAAETFDMALTLHADHGFNASTFTTLVIVSTYADIYSAVTGGIGALSGPWHGGANEDVMRTLIDIAEADADAIKRVAEMLEAGERIPGWGHRVYNVKDPRATILQERSRALAEASSDRRWYDLATAIEDYLTDEVDLPSKDIAPNVDFYSGTVYYQLDIPFDLFTPIFAVSRVGGWVAHVLEYQAENRLIRPRARYVGPDPREFVPLEDR